MALNPESEKKISRLVERAWKPPTFTDQELGLPISIKKAEGTLVSTKEYIASFDSEKQNSVLPPDELNIEEAVRLVTARLNEMADQSVGFLGKGAYTLKELLKEVQSQSELGKQILESEIFNLVMLQRLINKFESRKRKLVEH